MYIDNTINLPYGKGKISFEKYRDFVYDVLEPNNNNLYFEENSHMIREALKNPIGTLPLSEFATGKKEIVILVSDITRPCPSDKILSPLLEELHLAGIQKDQITIIFGLGLHRKHTEEEQKKIVGQYIYDNYKCIDHDVNDCIYLGETSRRTPIYVFKSLTTADFIIATGNLDYHFGAGYSGGLKAAMPGVCGEQTIRMNHRFMFVHGSMAGKIEGNPMREDIDEIGSVIGVNFIVNVVLDSNKNILKVVAGDPIKAHRVGCRYIDTFYKKNINFKYDVVIASPGGFPKDINLYQAHKGLDNASLAVKDGGAMILVAEAKQGFENDLFYKCMTESSTPDEIIEEVINNFQIGGHKAAKYAQIMKKTRVYLISSIDPKVCKKIFMHPVKNIEEALELEHEIQNKQLRCLIIPYAGSILPVPQDDIV